MSNYFLATKVEIFQHHQIANRVPSKSRSKGAFQINSPEEIWS